MTITFRLQEIPHAKDEMLRGYFPVLAHSARITSADLCRMIQERCTATEGDVKGVMSAMAQVMKQALAEGMRVEVPELGSFSPSISSDQPITDVADKQIARHLRIDNVNFHPKATLMKDFGRVAFRRADKVVTASPMHTDAELIDCIRTYYAEHPDEVMDRLSFQTLTGYGRTTAYKVLSHLVREGLLEKKGRPNSPYYVIAKAESQGVNNE